MSPVFNFKYDIGSHALFDIGEMFSLGDFGNLYFKGKIFKRVLVLICGLVHKLALLQETICILLALVINFCPNIADNKCLSYVVLEHCFPIPQKEPVEYQLIT